jgi:release factor glutamine methyltransferase
LKNSSLTGVDISKGALNVAIKNKKVNNLDVNFIESNLFENVRSKFDVIVSNPPYIAFDEEVEKIVALNEPTLALYAENNGLYFYEEILKESSNYLLPKFLIAFEIPENKDDLLIELVNKYYPNNHFNIYKDLNDLSRILLIKSDRR